LQAGVNAIPGLKVLSNPEMSVFAIASDSMDVYQIADELSVRGWHLDRQHRPACLHVTVNFVHTEVAEEFLRDLVMCADIVRRPTFQKTATRFMVRAANALTRVLPEAWVSRLMGKASALLNGGGGGGLPGRMAPMYGLIGTLPNRGDLKELVLDLLDSMTRTSNQ
jgi:hypothetical protein